MHRCLLALLTSTWSNPNQSTQQAVRFGRKKSKIKQKSLSWRLLDNLINRGRSLFYKDICNISRSLWICGDERGVPNTFVGLICAKRTRGKYFCYSPTSAQVQKPTLTSQWTQRIHTDVRGLQRETKQSHRLIIYTSTVIYPQNESPGYVAYLWSVL